MKKQYKLFNNIYVEIDYKKYEKEILVAIRNLINLKIKDKFIEDGIECNCLWKLANKLIVDEILILECDNIEIEVDELLDEIYFDLQEYSKKLI